MFLRVVTSRTPAPAPVQPLDSLAYYNRELTTGPLREISALEQIYGYWTRD